MKAPTMMRSFRSHPSVLYQIRQFVREHANDASLSPDLVGDLLVAVTEACANSMLHTTSPEIRLSWTVVDGCVEVEVLDDGVFRRRAPLPEVGGRGGHGIPLMMALVDEVTIQEGTLRHPGTRVRLVKCQGR